MTLSPLDIRRQQFAKALRGYDPAEVDAFLKQVSEQQESMLESVRRAEEKAREAEAKLVHYERVELALQEALESARESARRSEATAEEKARLTIEEAELRAERLVQEAERERYAIRQDLATLGARRAEAAARLRGFLLAELEVLAQFQGSDPVGFLKLEPSGAALLPGPPAEAPAPAPAAAPEEGPPPAAASGPAEAPADPSADGPEPLAAPLDASGSEADAEGPDGPEPAEEENSEEGAEPAAPKSAGGWDLRSLVTGAERSGAASEAERERIRRILDELD